MVIFAFINIVTSKPVKTIPPACHIASAILIGGCLLPVLVRAAPLLRCQIEQGGDTTVLDFRPVADPYRVAAIDIHGRFRFKAVVIGDAQHIDYIKLYVYAQTKRQPMLLHETNYVAPMASREPGYAALTGVNHVYSPALERELQYGCTLLEGAP